MQFFRHLVAGANPENIFDNLSIISFNYDRCTEYFLFHAVKAVFSVGDAEAAEAMQSLQILHPYGTVGLLPELSDAAGGVPFGQQTSDCSALRSSIHTYTEQISDRTQQALVHHVIRDCGRLIFMGFAFHQQNMKLLRPQDGIERKPIYA